MMNQQSLQTRNAIKKPNVVDFKSNLPFKTYIQVKNSIFRLRLEINFKTGAKFSSLFLGRGYFALLICQNINNEKKKNVLMFLVLLLLINKIIKKLICFMLHFIITFFYSLHNSLFF